MKYATLLLGLAILVTSTAAFAQFNPYPRPTYPQTMPPATVVEPSPLPQTPRIYQPPPPPVVVQPPPFGSFNDPLPPIGGMRRY